MITASMRYVKTWIASYIVDIGIFSRDEIGQIFGAIQLLEETIERITEHIQSKV